MRRCSSTRALSVMLAVSAVAAFVGFAPAGHAATEVTACHDAALARQRTEVNADMTVPRFDPALGTLLEVSVPNQAMHLDTDAMFENTAQTAVTFAEQMTYQVAFTSPAGLASPAAITGAIDRVPSQTLAAFDGTLDYTGASAVVQPSTARDATAAAVSATDPATLAAFTGGWTLETATAVCDEQGDEFETLDLLTRSRAAAGTSSSSSTRSSPPRCACATGMRSPRSAEPP